ncbi:unnamed protein product [Pocillopora meandrina]|uniref:Uncharacterized protein n=1 Tax=Pocillopora meandrina TaxID=46732 RepID=A0AAU9X8Y0_9CNID|nr:unnamed protein product [Pocillopora meandrina]
MKWCGKFYVDLAFPFVLLSAHYIFNCFASLLRRFHNGCPPPSPYSPQCVQNLSTALLVCYRLGLPLHPGKFVGPTLVLTVRCIDLDSLAQVARLPEGKLQALKELIL